MQKSNGLLLLVFAGCLAVLSLTAQAKAATAPKLVKYEYTLFSTSAHAIFEQAVPFTALTPVDKNLVLKYRPYVIRQLSRGNEEVAKGYHLRRAAIRKDAHEGNTVIYYETIYSKKVCEVTAVAVQPNGNFSMASSPC